MDPTLEYPAITAFVRGYLHQDAKAEYGTAVAAAEQFRRDADEVQLNELRRECDQFFARHATLHAINRTLSRLGSSWLFHTQEEFRRMLDAIARR